jgi:hypothetical protein
MCSVATGIALAPGHVGVFSQLVFSRIQSKLICAPFLKTAAASLAPQYA